MAAAISTLELCVAEREKRLAAFLKERGVAMPKLPAPELGCPLAIAAEEPYVEHVEWVRGLADEDVSRCVEWLRAVEAAVIAAGEL
ncbi:hypothetical protein OV079_36755 [Nannocystis pusilla]|uniref:Uncharacterized protein n=1 Tax=Nannocystis pusilla TaxID=889268 RepID=A0A9X3J1S6_9BACT|nr:hypothetical protein [Nannocystis pusilla]MCY1011024.1 hypothetical protein [Nannocystis pusilla]